MSPSELTEFLRRSIPLLTAVDVQVRVCTPQHVVLEAPLANNLNHHHTAFGGSLALLSVLTGWSLLHVALRDAGIDAALVVQRSQCRFDRPVTGALVSEARLPAEHWPAFVDRLRSRGRARIDLHSRVIGADAAADAVIHDATYAALIEPA